MTSELDHLRITESRNSPLAAPLFHGSRKKGLNDLLIEKSCEGNPFGPGIYLTGERLVARTYGFGGSIYEVAVNVCASHVLDLDQPIERQTPYVSAVLHALFSQQSAVLLGGKTMRRALDQWMPAAIERTRSLAASGIPMLVGHLDGAEISGLGDRGPQYVVLENGRITSMTETAP